MFQCSRFNLISQADLTSIFNQWQPASTPHEQQFHGYVNQSASASITPLITRQANHQNRQKMKDTLHYTFGNSLNGTVENNTLLPLSEFLKTYPECANWVYCLSKQKLLLYDVLDLRIPSQIDGLLVLPSARQCFGCELSVSVTSNWRSSLTISTQIQTESIEQSFMCGLDILNNGDIFPIKRITNRAANSVWFRAFRVKPNVDLTSDGLEHRGTLRLTCDGKKWSIQGEILNEVVDVRNNPTFPSSPSSSSHGFQSNGIDQDLEIRTNHKLKLNNYLNDHYTAIQAASDLTSNMTWTLPERVPANSDLNTFVSNLEGTISCIPSFDTQCPGEYRFTEQEYSIICVPDVDPDRVFGDARTLQEGSLSVTAESRVIIEYEVDISITTIGAVYFRVERFDVSGGVPDEHQWVPIGLNDTNPSDNDLLTKCWSCVAHDATLVESARYEQTICGLFVDVPGYLGTIQYRIAFQSTSAVSIRSIRPSITIVQQDKNHFYNAEKTYGILQCAFKNNIQPYRIESPENIIAWPDSEISFTPMFNESFIHLRLNSNFTMPNNDSSALIIIQKRIENGNWNLFREINMASSEFVINGKDSSCSLISLSDTSIGFQTHFYRVCVYTYDEWVIAGGNRNAWVMNSFVALEIVNPFQIQQQALKRVPILNQIDKGVIQMKCDRISAITQYDTTNSYPVENSILLSGVSMIRSSCYSNMMIKFHSFIQFRNTVVNQREIYCKLERSLDSGDSWSEMRIRENSESIISEQFYAADGLEIFKSYTFQDSLDRISLGSQINYRIVVSLTSVSQASTFFISPYLEVTEVIHNNHSIIKTDVGSFTNIISDVGVDMLLSSGSKRIYTNSDMVLSNPTAILGWKNENNHISGLKAPDFSSSSFSIEGIEENKSYLWSLPTSDYEGGCVKSDGQGNLLIDSPNPDYSSYGGQYKFTKGELNDNLLVNNNESYVLVPGLIASITPISPKSQIVIELHTTFFKQNSSISASCWLNLEYKRETDETWIPIFESPMRWIHCFMINSDEWDKQLYGAYVFENNSRENISFRVVAKTDQLLHFLTIGTSEVPTASVLSLFEVNISSSLSTINGMGKCKYTNNLVSQRILPSDMWCPWKDSTLTFQRPMRNPATFLIKLAGNGISVRARDPPRYHSIGLQRSIDGGNSWQFVAHDSSGSWIDGGRLSRFISGQILDTNVNHNGSSVMYRVVAKADQAEMVLGLQPHTGTFIVTEIMNEYISPPESEVFLNWNAGLVQLYSIQNTSGVELFTASDRFLIPGFEFDIQAKESNCVYDLSFMGCFATDRGTEESSRMKIKLQYTIGSEEWESFESTSDRSFDWIDATVINRQGNFVRPVFGRYILSSLNLSKGTRLRFRLILITEQFNMDPTAPNISVRMGYSYHIDNPISVTSFILTENMLGNRPEYQTKSIKIDNVLTLPSKTSEERLALLAKTGAIVYDHSMDSLMLRRQDIWQPILNIPMKIIDFDFFSSFEVSETVPEHLVNQFLVYPWFKSQDDDNTNSQFFILANENDHMFGIYSNEQGFNTTFIGVDLSPLNLTPGVYVIKFVVYYRKNQGVVETKCITSASEQVIDQRNTLLRVGTGKVPTNVDGYFRITPSDSNPQIRWTLVGAVQEEAGSLPGFSLGSLFSIWKM